MPTEIEMYTFIANGLVEFNYPNINNIEQEEEISEVFSKANRMFLVSWFLKQLNDDYFEIVEEASEEDLGGILVCNGFCSSKEKKEFIRGECDYERQMKILYKMFKHLKSVSDSRKLVEKPETQTLEDVENIVNFDTNMFPMYGPKKTLTPTQKQQKMKEFQKEIDELKQLMSGGTGVGNNLNFDPNLRHQFEGVMKDLEVNFPSFERNVLELLKHQKSGNVESCFGESFSGDLANCTEKLTSLLELIKNTNVIMKSQENDVKMKITSDCQKENLQMFREILELYEEIAQLKRK